MSSIKNISFEVTDNWSIGGFRNFIKLLLSEDTAYNVFIISNDDSTDYIYSVASVLGIATSNIKICNFTDDKIQEIEDNDIHVHLDNLQSFVLLVDETTDAHGVLVTSNINKYYLLPDYVLVFNRTIKMLESEES